MVRLMNEKTNVVLFFFSLLKISFKSFFPNVFRLISLHIFILYAISSILPFQTT